MGRSLSQWLARSLFKGYLRPTCQETGKPKNARRAASFVLDTGHRQNLVLDASSTLTRSAKWEIDGSPHRSDGQKRTNDGPLTWLLSGQEDDNRSSFDENTGHECQRDRLEYQWALLLRQAQPWSQLRFQFMTSSAILPHSLDHEPCVNWDCNNRTEYYRPAEFDSQYILGIQYFISSLSRYRDPQIMLLTHISPFS